MTEWYRPAGSAGRAGFDVAIGPREAGWEHTGLYVVTLGPGESRRIIACEVLTPAGNWSSYPSHKHDEHRQDRESVLEEIYYFEMRAEGSAPTSSWSPTAGTVLRWHHPDTTCTT